MSNCRSIVLLMCGIALLLLAHAFLRMDGVARSVSFRESLVDASLRPDALVLERGSGPRVVLENAGGWQLLSPYRGGADEQAVHRLVDALAMTAVEDCIADAELLRLGRTRKDFGLDPPHLRVGLRRQGEKAEVSFGGLTPAGTGRYAAVSGVEAVYVVSTALVSAVDLEADAFRRRALFAVGPESVVSFDVKHGAGALIAFTRSGAGWLAGRERASEQRVRRLLAGLTTAMAAEFVWPTGATNEALHVTASLLAGYGLEPESAVTVTLKEIDGRSQQVSFGKEAGDKLVYALVQNGCAIVKVPASLKDAAAQDPALFADSRLFPADASSVAFITLSEGTSVCSLSRAEDGAWRLESPIVAPADKASVEDLLAKILNLSPADGAAEGVAVSLAAGSAPIVVSKRALLGDRGFGVLRSREILKIDPALVRRIVSTRSGEGSKPVSVVYDRERRQWNVELPQGGGSASVPGIERALSALNPLVAVRIERLQASTSELAAFGLETPSLVLAVDQDRENAVRRNLLVGARCHGGRYATVGSSDAVFVISDGDFERISGTLIEP